MTGVVIRELTDADDLARLSAVYEQSWKYAYRGIVPDAFLDSMESGRWANAVKRPGRRSLLAVDAEGRFVGTCSFGRARSAQWPAQGEIVSLYLVPEVMGQGVGKALLLSAVDALRDMGFAEAYLWVLEENVRARTFYANMGWVPSGEVLDDIIGGKPLRELRYTLYLG